MPKTVAVYGTYKTKVPMKQRYWKWVYHRKGEKAGQRWYKRRFWVFPKNRFKTVIRKGRYEFSGDGKALYKAIVTATEYVPNKSHVVVSALDFIENPEDYGDNEGDWIDFDVES